MAAKKTQKVTVPDVCRIETYEIKVIRPPHISVRAMRAYVEQAVRKGAAQLDIDFDKPGRRGSLWVGRRP